MQKLKKTKNFYFEGISPPDYKAQTQARDVRQLITLI